MSAIVDRIAQWYAPHPDEPTTDPGNPIQILVRTIVSAGLLLLVFLLFDRFASRLCRLPESDFAATSLLVACVSYRLAFLLPALALACGLLALLPRLRHGWQQFDGGEALRWFITAITLILAWTGSAYAFNPWYGQPHLVDRATLTVLAVLVAWRPAFVLPFVVAFWAIVWQFDDPPLGFQILTAEFRPVVNVLAMFSAALLVEAMRRSRDMSVFVFMVVCIVAANFWVPGLTKLQIGWITHGHVYFLLPNAYTHGWLGFLDPRTVGQLGGMLAAVDWPMRLVTLIVECSALFVMARAWVARVLLLAFTLILGAFFLTLGYLFWKWIVVHVALWSLLFGASAHAATWRRRIFSRPHFIVSLVIIAGASNWFHPAALAWFDTSVANALQYEGVGRSGAFYDLPASFFAPYESHVAMASFAGRLTGAPLLTGPYGATGNKTHANALLQARTPADVLRMETASDNEITVDEVFAAQFDEFVRRAVTAANQRLEPQSVRRLRSWIRPLPFLWTFSHGPIYRRDEAIESVRVYWVSSFFDGREYQIFRRTLVRTIDVQAAESRK